MSAWQEAAFWLALLAGTVLVLWLLGGILLPFVLGMAIGYFLDPLVGWLERHGLSRATAAGAIILSSFAAGLAALLLFLPPLLHQTVEALGRLPSVIAAVRQWLEPWAARFFAGISDTPAGDLTTPLAEAVQRSVGSASDLLAGVWTQGIAVVNVLSLLAVTPLVAFYLLRDWPRVVAEVDGWLPRAYADTIREQLRAMDAALAGFARGSALVCALLAAFYALALSVVGLEFGLVIGLVAGGVSFVPYLGFAIGLIASAGVALVQYWPDWPWIVVVLGIFFVGQWVTDYLLTPRLVGDRVGLHPLWVLFAVFAGGALFGFVGMLLSVPACAMVGVLTRFAIGRYKASALYQGASPPPVG